MYSVCAAEGHVQVLRLLLQHGADINIRAANGSTPLHWAAQQGRLEVVTELVHSGADIHATTNSYASVCCK